ncbi:zinc ribbon domain-containing protein [Mycobacterium sp. E2989]|uniref:double zinc ribbon domain-containing protein n=1 Tax=Mycobacterium sp. E2989 TaxID=1834140 RepID=UPI0009EE3597
MPSWPSWPSWRPFTQLILAAQLGFAAWLYNALESSNTDCPKDQVADFCQAGKALGMAVGGVFILFIWALVDVILGVCWVVTNDRLRECPECGAKSKNGFLACPDCGYQFVPAASPVGSHTKTCPDCAESVRAKAKVCRYCGHQFPTQKAAPAKKVTPTKTVTPAKKVRCFKCQHVQAVLASETEYTCEQCGQRLKRK